MTVDVEQLQRIMRGLKCSEDEAREIMKYDKAIDRGERVEFDLPPDKLKIAQKFTHTGTRTITQTATKKKRERKPNATKGGIISELFAFINGNCEFSTENVKIMNAERQISFQIGTETYELTLVQKRKTKK